MRYFIRDRTIDLTCTVNELYTMHERGMAIDGMTHGTIPNQGKDAPILIKNELTRDEPVFTSIKNRLQ